MRRSIAIVGLLGLGLAAGCSSAGRGGPSANVTVAQQGLEALIPLQGCSEVSIYIKERLVAETHRRASQAIDALLRSDPSSCSLAQKQKRPAEMRDPSGTSGAGGGTGGANAESGAGASEVSGTNNQVASVDEADFIKNDDKYLYVASKKTLKIIRAWPAPETAIVASVPLDGDAKSLFVEGDRALVYLSVPKPASRPTNDGSPNAKSAGAGGRSGSGSESRTCTYGYDCIPSGDGTATKLVVFDIANRAAPTRLREIDLSGSLLAARRIGNAVHTVVVDAMPEIPGLQKSPARDATNGCSQTNLSLEEERGSAIASWEAVRAHDLAVIEAADVLGSLPTILEGGVSATPACSGFYRPSKAEGLTFTSIVSIDIAAGGPPASASVVSDPGVVYASETGLYMSVPHSREEQAGWLWYAGFEGEKQASTVHKFRIGASPVLTGYEASGVVKGRVLNQFALDEHEGHLRIATTTGRAPQPATHSTLSVLRPEGNSLTLAGRVDQIAPTEDIRSVRFDGSRGYIVTFKKTDPLFVLDLGDPAAPRIAGELKIPGFSTYMHMMDAQHLLTIGYDADDRGSFAYFQGVLLQIFDVSDMRNPRLAHKEVIGTRGSSSEALTNHLAFTYFAPKNVLALPMTVCEGGWSGSSGTDMTFSGLLVYDVTTAGGFVKRGQVPHPNALTGASYDSAGCSNWWTNASSEVRRSVIMDDFVYSVSDRRVKVNALGNLGADLAEVPLE